MRPVRESAPAARRSDRSPRRSRSRSDRASPRRSARSAPGRVPRHGRGRRSSGVTSSEALRRQDFAQAAELRHRLARGRAGLDVAMQAGVGYLRHDDGNAPGIRACSVMPVGSAHGCAPACAGEGNFHDPPSSVASSRPARARDRRLGIGGEPPRFFDLLAVQDILAQRLRQRLRGPRPAQDRRPPPGRKRPPRRPAFASAP